MPLENATAAAALNAVTGRIDLGSAAGKLQIYTAAFGTLLIEFTLDDPAFGTATSASPSVAAAAGLPKTAVAADDGTAAAYRFVDSDDNVRISRTGSGAVGTSAADVILSNTSIVDGRTYELTAATLTMPATLAGE